MKLGFLVKDLWLSQMSYYLTMNVNSYKTIKEIDDAVVFFEDVSQYSVSPLFSTMNSSEIWGFDGVLISTCLSTTLSSIAAIGPIQKIFYVWDLDWMRNGRDYEYNIKAFSPEVKIIARSEDHGVAIKNYCNREPDGYVSNFNLQEFMRVINDE